jgi:phosphoglycerate dehydrogenase-like enzyme
MNEGPAVSVVFLHATEGNNTLPAAMRRLEAQLSDVTVRYTTGADLAELLPGTDVLFLWDYRSHALAEAWSSADTLRWVHAASAGVNHILTDEVKASDVVVTNSRGVFDEPMAEYVLGVALAFAKDLPTTLRLQGERRWHHRETERLAGRRALVAGTGPIGRAIARKLTAAGLVVTGLGRRALTDDADFGTVLPMAELSGALADTDYLVLAAPLTEQTTGMIDAAALAAMKPTARLINVGRGPLVVEDDLVTALRAGTIAGAALDVFADEPLAESSPLWDLPNAMISPHMSGDVVGWRDELVALFADNLDRFTSGRELRNVVDKNHGYVRG